LTHRITEAADKNDADRAASFGEEVTRQVEKAVLMQTLDNLWREHIVTLDHLRQVIGLRSFAQRDPLIEYKSEGYQLFGDMMRRWREDVTRTMFRLQVMQEPAPPSLPQMFGQHIDPLTGEDEFALAGSGFPPSQISAPSPVGEVASLQAVAPEDRDPDNPSTWGRIGRNETCPCGSGKKYKHCHGQIA
jgi:preprotein translocase subunit SecA